MGEEWVLLALLNQYISKAFYSELRTKQQLGYIVQCAANEIDGVRGIVFVVQSNAQPPQVVMEPPPPPWHATPPKHAAPPYS